MIIIIIIISERKHARHGLVFLCLSVCLFLSFAFAMSYLALVSILGLVRFPTECGRWLNLSHLLIKMYCLFTI